MNKITVNVLSIVVSLGIAFGLHSIPAISKSESFALFMRCFRGKIL